MPSRLGILAGTFNPPTVAHLALAEAARGMVDEIVFVLPETFPHKPYSGASRDQRIQMLRTALAGLPNISIAVSAGGLFAEIAAECRTAYGPSPRLSFLCGKDAAERIANWDYGRPGAFDEMLREFDLVVAARAGAYDAPPAWRERIGKLTLSGPFDHVSATEVRERIARGGSWEQLVPPAIHAQARAIYTSIIR